MVDHHPNEDDLFLLADGGLHPLKAWMVRLHLKRCWSCRRMVDGHRSAMHAIVDHRERVHRGTAHLDAAMKARFAQRLSQARVEERAPLIRRVYLPVSAAVAAAMALVVILFWRVPSVSADSMLERAAAAEPSATPGVAAPVIRQELRLRRGKGATSTLVVWTDLATREQHGGEANREWDEYRRILAHNRVSAMSRSLAAIHREWRSGIRRKQESVTQRAGSTLLRTEAEGPFQTESIARMDLEVRDQDWRALRQTVYVEAGGGLEQYEVEEVAEAVVARAAVPEGIFASARTPQPETAAVEPAPNLPALAAVASPAQLISTEVQVWLALHRLNDCLGEPVEIVRADGTIVVRGHITDSSRRRELAAALEQIRYARLDLLASAESAPLPSSGTPASSAASSSPPADWVNPLQLLKMDAAQSTELINTIVPLSGAALDQVWALRRLAERFSDSTLTSLSPAERAAIEQMLRNHQAQLAGALAQLKQTLAPILPAASTPAAEATSWASTTLADFSAVQSVDRSIASLLVPAAPSEGVPILRALSASLAASVRLTDDLPRAFQAAATK